MMDVIRVIMKVPPLARKLLELTKMKRTNPRNEREITVAEI